MAYIIENKTSDILIYNTIDKKINYYKKSNVTVEAVGGQLIIKDGNKEVLRASWTSTTSEVLSPASTDLKNLVDVVYNYITGTDPTVSPSSVETTDPYLSSSLGIDSGVSHINKFGKNNDVDTGAAEDVVNMGGLYVTPTQARVHDIVSDNVQDKGTLVSSGTITTASLSTIVDSAADFVSDGVAAGDLVLNDTSQDHSIVITIDSATQLTVRDMHHGDSNSFGDTYRIVTSVGTGSIVIHIKEGLLADLSSASEFVILNGTSNVATSSLYVRINKFHAHGAGSSGSNVGTITATAQTDSTVTSQIDPTEGQAQMLFYTVPKGKSAYISNINMSLFRSGAASDALAQISLYESLWAGFSDKDGEMVWGSWGVSVHSSTAVQYGPYLYISEYSDVWLRVDSVSDNNSIVSANMNMYIVDKSTV